LARLERAIEQAPRPYHLVVLSDHGQSQGRPFRQRYDVELEELVRSALSAGDVYSPPAPDEGLSSVGGALTDARVGETAGGRMLAGATRDRVIDGEVVLGPNREAAEKAKGSGSEHGAIVLASGGLGLISFPAPEHRLTLEEIEGMHPGLVQALREHPGI